MKTAQDLIDALNANEDADIEMKMTLLLALIDLDALKKELMMSAKMVEIGMTTPKLCESFTYTILSVLRPGFFAKDGPAGE